MPPQVTQKHNPVLPQVTQKHNPVLPQITQKHNPVLPQVTKKAQPSPTSSHIKAKPSPTSSHTKSQPCPASSHTKARPKSHLNSHKRTIQSYLKSHKSTTQSYLKSHCKSTTQSYIKSHKSTTLPYLKSYKSTIKGKNWHSCQLPFTVDTPTTSRESRCCKCMGGNRKTATEINWGMAHVVFALARPRSNCPVVRSKRDVDRWRPLVAFSHVLSKTAREGKSGPITLLAPIIWPA